MDLHQLVTEIKEKVDLIYGAMVGDPLDHNKPGFLTRLDRVENSLKFSRKMYWILFSALASAIGFLASRLLL
jgi:hypothetical protein